MQTRQSPLYLSPHLPGWPGRDSRVHFTGGKTWAQGHDWLCDLVDIPLAVGQGLGHGSDARAHCTMLTVPMHVCANTHTRIHTWVYIDTFAHADTQTHTHHTHACTHIHRHIHRGTHRYTRTQTHHLHSYTYADTHYIHSCVHTQAYTDTSAYTHWHIQMTHTHAPLGPEAL